MTNLQNLHILVTRPEPQGEELCRLINAHGGEAISFPTIAFVPKDFHHTLPLLGEQDWLIFISPQAVYSSIPQIRKAWPQLPETVKFAAVGAGTARVLQQAGYNVSIHPEADWSSVGVLALSEFRSVSGKKIAIVRGVGGREILDKTLAERGADILPVITYERVLPDVDVTECVELLEKGIINIIVCTSYDGVKNLKILLGEKGWPYLQEIPVIVMSERIKSLAHDLGFRRIWVTRNASQEAILDLIAEKRKE